MRILVVDDMGAMRQTVKKALAALGFKDTVEAKNGQDAFDTLLNSYGLPGKEIGLGIIDWNMTPVPGIDLLKMVRTDERLEDFVFIMLTAEQLRDNIVAAIQSGVDEYIIKPFTPVTLKEKFGNVTKIRLSKLQKEVDSFCSNENRDPAQKKQALNRFYKKTAMIGEMSPWSYLAPLFMGRLFFRFGKLKEAEEWFRRTLKIDFGIAPAHEYLATVLLQSGRVSEGLKEMQVAAVEQPSNAKLKIRLGQVMIDQGDVDNAMKILGDAVILIDKNSAEEKADLCKAKALLGTAELEKGIHDNSPAMQRQAMEHIRQSVNIYPEMIESRYRLYLALQRVKNNEGASAELENILSLNPDDEYREHLYIGCARQKAGESADAVGEFEKGVKLTPYQNRAETAKIVCSADSSGDWVKKAFAITDSLLVNDQADAEIHVARSNLLEREGDGVNAILEMEKGLSWQAENPSIHMQLGRLQARFGDRRKATNHMIKAKTLDPSIRESKVSTVATGASL